MSTSIPFEGVKRSLADCTTAEEVAQASECNYRIGYAYPPRS